MTAGDLMAGSSAADGSGFAWPFVAKVFAKTYRSFDAYVKGTGHQKLNGVVVADRCPAAG